MPGRGAWAVWIGGALACALFAGCGSDGPSEPAGPPGDWGAIAGIATLPGQAETSLRGAFVSVYRSLEDWELEETVVPTVQLLEESLSANFLIGAPPGRYFVEVWLDVDGSGTIDPGDWWGITGSSDWLDPVPSFITVTKGQTVTASVALQAVR